MSSLGLRKQHGSRLAQKSTLGIRLSSCPDGQTERSLVHQISNVVHDVHGRLSMVGEGRAQVDHVVSERVHDPPNGDDETEGVECGLACLGSRVSGQRSGFSEEDLKDNVEPSEHTDDESAKDGHKSRFSSPTTEEHDNGADEESPEERDRYIGGSLKDEVELNNLEWDGN